MILGQAVMSLNNAIGSMGRRTSEILVYSRLSIDDNGSFVTHRINHVSHCKA